jgi:folylpolyglutamate synthase
MEFDGNDAGLNGANSSRASSVFESLPQEILWVWETAQQNQSTQFQVLVTGSLHLVGDVLRLLKK